MPIAKNKNDFRANHRTRVGAVAASYLQRVIEREDVIGVSWGYTIRGMVAALEPKGFPQACIVQMTGGIGKPESEAHATELFCKMAHTLGCKLALLPAPGVVNSKETRAVYLADEHVHAAMELLPKIALAFVGIGSFNSCSIANRFIDSKGQPVQSELNERIIGISLEQLRRVHRVVGVAGGKEKIEAIYAALFGKLLNVLITDQETAEALLRRASC